MIRNFWNSYKAEYIKTKASGLKWLCLGAAAFIPLIQLIFFLSVGKEEFIGAKADNPWMTFVQGSFNGFAPFFFPLLCVLIAVRLAQFEHKSDTWKLIETQPVHKSSLYFSKWLMVLTVSLVCLVLVAIFATACAFVLSITDGSPEYKTSSIVWDEALWLIIKLWISSFGLTAIQYFLSVRISNFVGPFIIGLIATIAGSIMSGFESLSWWPYSAPALSVSQFKNFKGILPYEKLSIAFMLLFLFLGYMLFVHKKIKLAFLQPATRLIPLVGLLAAVTFTFWYINKPIIAEKYNKTVIAGEFKTEDSLKTVYLLDPVTDDTIQYAQLKNNKFSITVPQDLQPTYYHLRAGNELSVVYFGKGDSVYVSYEKGKAGQRNQEITGTRIAENSFSGSRYGSDNLWFLESKAYEYKPNAFARAVVEEWEDGVKTIDNYKTANNYKPGSDFTFMKKKMLALKLMKLLDVHYPKVFAVYYPGDTLKYPPSVEVIRKAAGDVIDPALMAEPQYVDFLAGYFRSRPEVQTEADYYNYIVTRLPANNVRDLLLHTSLTETINKVGDSARRSLILDTYGSKITSRRLHASLVSKNDVINKLQKGKPAPAISAETLNGLSFNLDNLKNKYIVIDVWATWCGPCKKQAPFFKDLAERYTSEHVVFVSLSIDEDKNAWKAETYGGGRVLQLWAKLPKEELHKNYNIASIPRFMLIDNKGKIVSANMPPPSEPEFENILERETAYLTRSFY